VRLISQASECNYLAGIVEQREFGLSSREQIVVIAIEGFLG
jgi:hypothetical protein